MNNIMMYNRMVQDLIKPGQAILANLTPEACHLLHMSWALSGELVEFRTAMLEGDVSNMREELGDIEFYFNGIVIHMPPNCLGTCEGVIEMDPEQAFHNLLELSGGDNLTKVMKDHTMYAKPLDMARLLNVVFSINQALVNLYAALEFNRNEIKLENMDKLLGTANQKGRYGLGIYSDKQASERADKQVNG